MKHLDYSLIWINQGVFLQSSITVNILIIQWYIEYTRQDFVEKKRSNLDRSFDWKGGEECFHVVSLRKLQKKQIRLS